MRPDEARVTKTQLDRAAWIRERELMIFDGPTPPPPAAPQSDDLTPQEAFAAGVAAGVGWGLLIIALFCRN